MNRIVTTLALAGTLLLGGLASAQTSQPLPAANSKIIATFYDGNPYDGGTLVESDFTVELSNNSIGKTINGVEDANYIMLNIGEDNLAFEVQGEMSTNAQLSGVNNGEDIKLGEVVNDIVASLQGSTYLAIFTDSDGIVTGFYTFDEERIPNVNVPEADYVVFVYQDTSTFFQTVNPGTRSLESVNVKLNDGEETTLFNYALTLN
jgi:hypothetical protein